MSTPNKEININAKFSPIRFSNSPGNLKSPKSVTSTINQKILIIIKQILINHEKWNEYQKRGLTICLSIDRCKGQVLDNPSKSDTLYPNNLKSLCKQLNELLENFKSLLNYLNESKKQLIALGKLNLNLDEPIFKTWHSQDFIEFVTKLIQLYEEEIKIKAIVNENIAHSNNRKELVLHCLVWEYPKYVNAETDLLLKIVQKECF